MDNLIEKLQGLEPTELDYVMARSSSASVKEACEKIGLSQSTLYGWKERRDELEDLATALRLDRHVEVELKLREALPDAVQAIIEGLKQRKYSDKFRAAVEVLDRTLGKSTQKIDQKTEVTNANVIDDDRFDRAISTLADAVREVVPGKGSESDSSVGASE